MSIKTIAIICIVLFLCLLAFTYKNEGMEYYKAIKEHSILKEKNKALEDEVKNKEVMIDENYKTIESLEKNRISLAKKLAESKIKRDAITNPQDINEINDRLRAIGLHPRIK